jgi:hypothetical protein
MKTPTHNYFRHCERKRSNPKTWTKEMDCFVAYAPRNDGECCHDDGGDCGGEGEGVCEGNGGGRRSVGGGSRQAPALRPAIIQ